MNEAAAGNVQENISVIGESEVQVQQAEKAQQELEPAIGPADEVMATSLPHETVAPEVIAEAETAAIKPAAMTVETPHEEEENEAIMNEVRIAQPATTPELEAPSAKPEAKKMEPPENVMMQDVAIVEKRAVATETLHEAAEVREEKSMPPTRGEPAETTMETDKTMREPAIIGEMEAMPEKKTIDEAPAVQKEEGATTPSLEAQREDRTVLATEKAQETVLAVEEAEQILAPAVETPNATEVREEILISDSHDAATIAAPETPAPPKEKSGIEKEETVREKPLTIAEAVRQTSKQPVVTKGTKDGIAVEATEAKEARAEILSDETPTVTHEKIAMEATVEGAMERVPSKAPPANHEMKSVPGREYEARAEAEYEHDDAMPADQDQDMETDAEENAKESLDEEKRKEVPEPKKMTGKEILLRSLGITPRRRPRGESIFSFGPSVRGRVSSQPSNRPPASQRRRSNGSSLNGITLRRAA